MSLVNKLSNQLTKADETIERLAEVLLRAKHDKKKIKQDLKRAIQDAEQLARNKVQEDISKAAVDRRVEVMKLRRKKMTRKKVAQELGISISRCVQIEHQGWRDLALVIRHDPWMPLPEKWLPYTESLRGMEIEATHDELRIDGKLVHKRPRKAPYERKREWMKQQAEAKEKALEEIKLNRIAEAVVRWCNQHAMRLECISGFDRAEAKKRALKEGLHVMLDSMRDVPPGTAIEVLRRKGLELNGVDYGKA